jgi:hypothetical protein
MSRSDIPEVRPAVRAAPPEMLPVAAAVPPEVLPVLPARPAPPPRPPQTAWGNPVLRTFASLFGWIWRLAVGALMCFNYYVLSYFTSIFAVGWTYRWMQAVVLRGWWKQSPKRHDGSFRDFCDSLGLDGPVPRPRWFLRERIVAFMRRPGPGGQPASGLRLFGRALTIPWHSLWLNFKIGLAGVFCTFLLTGWGCLLMVFGWEFGWFNSINRYYEQYLFGPGSFLLGLVLFILAMFYVPMAQAHQAATGQARAFFEFRFVRRLIRARLMPYVGLAMLTGFASLILTIVVLQSVGENFAGNDRTLSPEEGFQVYWVYLLAFTAFLLFPLYLLLRFVAAVIYRSAVLKALRQGTITRAELNPVLARWMERMELKVIPRAETVGLGWYARLTTRFAYRRVLFTVLFFVWLVFATRMLVHHFFRSDPVVGYLNHPMIQMPCFDFIPAHLYQGKNE